MKKTIIITLLALVVGGGLRAQDTLWQKPAPKDNYFNNHWIDTTGQYAASPAGIPFANTIARKFVAKGDTLQIYGIAAMMVTPLFHFIPWTTWPDEQTYLNNNFPDDPTLEHCEESLLLFQYHSGNPPTMQQLGDSLPVHALHTPVSYWIMSDRPVVSYYDTVPKPVYERYFPTPQTVYDTFYAGFTQWHSGFIGKNDTLMHINIRPWLKCLCFDHTGCNLSMVYEDETAAWVQNKYSWPHEWEFYPDDNICAFFIFPILTPQDTTIPNGDTIVPGGDTIVPGGDTIVPGGDTIVPGGDTLAVRHLGQLSRYVAVQPNPAVDRATVLSSFGLLRIEAYDPAGRRILDSKATGLRATLDVAAWPRGTYLLRIHTPRGTATKKLLLR